MGMSRYTLYLLFYFIMFILWYWYDKTGIAFTGGFRFTYKCGHTQISVHNMIVTYTLLKNILHQYLSIWHIACLNTGVRSNQKKNQFAKWRPNISFLPQSKIFPSFITHFKEKALPFKTTKTTKEKGFLCERYFIFCCYIIQKENSKRDYCKQQKSI